ncbi:gamma-glutamylcyclotransferase [Mesorhizobium sp. NBSH29]|nr:gamma-glutamylcyclotransferase [Mesorhizobium sp. NBSH29]
MRLTQAHVAKLTQKFDDPGFIALPGYRVATDSDYQRVVAELVAETPGDGFWVFAYGSLIWNPACAFVEQRIGVVHGWHRAFCLGWDQRFRGNPEAPGLMLALDRGGQCRGALYRLPSEALAENLDRLVRREMSMVPSAFPPRWVTVKTGTGPVRALTFAMNRKSGRYVSGLPMEELAAVLACACGHRGSMAEYLFSTVSHLEQLGIHDRHLWALQDLVARHIEEQHGL